MEKINRGQYTCPHCGEELHYTEDDNEIYCDMCGRKIEILEEL
jgi:DNA-directed RNA polymerase subunit RPC12/RpoP